MNYVMSYVIIYVMIYSCICRSLGDHEKDPNVGSLTYVNVGEKPIKRL